MKIILLIVFIQLFVSSYSYKPYHDPHFVGNRSIIVQMLEWRWDDIAEECEKFLGPYGYGGVQTSPANENAVIEHPSFNNAVMRPWYERYQPVSYKITTRSGNEQQFRNMVDRCNKAGVRIYVDAVLNHMTGGGLKGRGTSGSGYDGDSMNYDGVPYSASNFNGHNKCPTNDLEIHNYDDPIQARNCRLVGLRDLDQGQEYVRNKQAEFLNHLIDIGVAGFRMDASKHQWPSDLQSIISRLHNLNTNYFPSNSKAFFYHEVIYYGSGHITSQEYLSIGRCLEFRYPSNIGDVFRKNNNKMLKYLKNFGSGWGMLPDDDAVVMIDSHDLQRAHSGSGNVNINFFVPRLLKMSTAFMLGWPYSIPKVMTSYSWNRNFQGNNDVNDWIGPPHDGSFNTLHVSRNADMSCGNGWVCEHRWRQIYNMVKFRNAVGNAPVANWWDNGGNQIAFSRGNRGFLAINNDNNAINAKLHTGLPSGTYCDVISGNLENGKCTGHSIKVNGDGTADISVDNKSEDPMIAIHVNAKVA